MLDRDDERKRGYAEMVEVIREYLGARYRVATLRSDDRSSCCSGSPRSRRGRRALPSRRWLERATSSSTAGSRADRPTRRKRARRRARAASSRPRPVPRRASQHDRAEASARGSSRPALVWPWLLVARARRHRSRCSMVSRHRTTRATPSRSCGTVARALVLLAAARGRRRDRVPPAPPARRRDGVLAGRARRRARDRRRGSSDLPGVLRVLARRVARGRARAARDLPHRRRTRVDTIDIMIVVDMSKSMEETDLPRDRLDAAQRVIRRFLRRTKNDRVGLVDLRPAGDAAVPADARHQDARADRRATSRSAMSPSSAPRSATASRSALAQLRRSDAKSKVVILLSDGDSNWVTRFEPDEAARAGQGDGRQGLHAARRPRGLRPVRRHVGQPGDAAQHRAASPAASSSARPTTSRSITASRPCATSSTPRSASHIEQVPDKQLFVPFALLAALLLGLELLLSHGRLRRLP